MQERLLIIQRHRVDHTIQRRSTLQSAKCEEPCLLTQNKSICEGNTVAAHRFPFNLIEVAGSTAQR